jgi:hypothetical protein
LVVGSYTSSLAAAAPAAFRPPATESRPLMAAAPPQPLAIGPSEPNQGALGRHPSCCGQYGNTCTRPVPSGAMTNKLECGSGWVSLEVQKAISPPSGDHAPSDRWA